ncbi:hypothetical protein B5S32_g978 [[Candida] boidinii]|uniref:Unnamed protein product n=1 Tax=Candida boidinii TaxID=5477 RepID=A0ACB5TXT1_CANBO|nr:hypothetical protein B5S32_g978 [[Candida] boidinii]GME96839.1 unnamed protein product [[Candida] boidinii]GME97365.1 unnamed protein product [[Candida] boidinii]
MSDTEEINNTIEHTPEGVKETEAETQTETQEKVTEESKESQEEEQEETKATEQETNENDGDLSDVDEDAIAAPDLDEDISKLQKHRKETDTETTTRKRSREDDDEEDADDAAANYDDEEEDEDDKEFTNDKKSSTKQEEATDFKEETEAVPNIEEEDDELSRRRREFEERFEALIKAPTSKKRKNGDVDLEAMQDEAISELKNMMKEAAYIDSDCVNNKKPATRKLKLLPQVKDTLLKSNLYDSILDNNLLEAVRIWLEPLPDSSLPAFEIQKTLLQELIKLPIKTIHLRESGLGKVMLFYQKSKKVDPSLKRIAEKLIGDWTRPIMGRSDNYHAKKVHSIEFDQEKFQSDLKLKGNNGSQKYEKRTLYQESADRRKRAAVPVARTSVYTVAPQVNTSLLQRATQQNVMGSGAALVRDERFKKLNQKLTMLGRKRSKK